MTRIPLFRPLLEQEEKQAAVDALDMGWLGLGAYVSQFENALKAFCDAEDRHVSCVATGFSALHLGLLNIGVGPGDEVITPSFNNIADFQAIGAVGAEPVLCDCRDDTLTIDVDKAARLVSSRTKALIVMDYGLINCDHDAVQNFAAQHGLRVLHDAAHSFGSYYKRKKIGSFSDMTMFSFDPIKTITTIDGGALVVKTAEEYEALHEMRLVGMRQSRLAMYENQRSPTQDVEQLGFRYHLANLHAALGLAQLSKIDRITDTRLRSARFYNESFFDVTNVRAPEGDLEGITPFLYYIRVPQRKRDALIGYLRDHGIDSGFHWKPAHWFTRWKDCRRGDLSVTDEVCGSLVTLPLYSSMELDIQERVVRTVRAFFDQC